ncbi:MAG: D-tyrosyl-tRNA(Tyr) deacylase [Ruminococcaceae bacterium]|nr:D-tyrosyl-tRNA(Tyr) deacylase [Oscillospiraceae bacterium]
MRAVIQRVKSAEVTVDGATIGKIGQGILVFLGVADEDNEQDMKYLADKIIGLRIFEDENEKMNLSLQDVGGSLLIVSQFTLYGDCRKGRRPSFDGAGKPDHANRLYEEMISYCKQQNVPTEHGQFAADMQVTLQNDGPVTLMLDSKKLF